MIIISSFLKITSKSFSVDLLSDSFTVMAVVKIVMAEALIRPSMRH